MIVLDILVEKIHSKTTSEIVDIEILDPDTRFNVTTENLINLSIGNSVRIRKNDIDTDRFWILNNANNILTLESDIPISENLKDEFIGGDIIPGISIYTSLVEKIPKSKYPFFVFEVMKRSIFRNTQNRFIPSEYEIAAISVYEDDPDNRQSVRNESEINFIDIMSIIQKPIKEPMRFNFDIWNNIKVFEIGCTFLHN